MRGVLLLLFVLLLATGVEAAEEGHIKLLAVADNGEEQEGITADLYLKVQPGTGKVFIESFPLTKIDTQISTRFSNDVVCNQLNLRCGKHDFFYTIQANSSIIGGPSAGAAVAVLTYAVLEDAPVKERVTITGTVNSGGLIGPVGGLHRKVMAASNVGFDTVLIPQGERVVRVNGSRVDLFEEAEELNITVIEVAEIEEAIFYATGQLIVRPEQDVEISPEYAAVMRQLADRLCSRASSLSEKIPENLMGEEEYETASSLHQRGQDAFANNTLYSAASFCFGASLNYRLALIADENLTPSQVDTRLDSLEEDIAELQQSLPAVLTATDIQTYAVVRERLSEASEYINTSRAAIRQRNQDDSLFNLAYATERINSAKSWATFFGTGSTNAERSEEELRTTCQAKIAEAEERIEYARLYFPNILDGISQQINQAAADLNAEDYSLCIFRAAKAKAESNAILGVLGVQDDQINIVIDKKLEVIERNIVKQTEQGIFPIVGYSYYEYADSLKTSNRFSSLLYAEYALELTNLDLYFKDNAAPQQDGLDAAGIIVALIAGITVFVVISSFVTDEMPSIGKIRNRKKRKR